MPNLRKLEAKDHYDQLPEMHERPKRFRKHDHDESNWLISYADMMTLLCMFYVMMFSMSKINSAEFEKVKQKVAEHFGTKYQSPTEDLGKFINNVITETGVQKDATMTSDGVSVTIAFHSTLFFDTGTAEISPNGRAIMTKLIAGLNDQQKKIGKNYKVVVEGHTDSQPIFSGQFPSNWELSSSRATRVVRLFLDQGYQPQNLLAIGYADTQPIAESKKADGNWNEENLAKNRRVVLRVLLPDVDSIPWKNEVKPAVAAPVDTKSAAVAPVSPTTPVATTPTTVPANAAPVAAVSAVATTPAVNAPVAAVAPAAPVVNAQAPVAAAPVQPSAVANGNAAFQASAPAALSPTSKTEVNDAFKTAPAARVPASK